MRLKPIVSRTTRQRLEMRARILSGLVAMAAVLFFAAMAVAEDFPVGMVSIPAGSYIPFFGPKDASGGIAPVDVPAFLMDEHPVTNLEYQEFVRIDPQWRKSRMKAVFADAHYLDQWRADLSFNGLNRQAPVTNVSWFAAKAYCEALGKTLPTTDQWEYVLADQGRNQSQVINRALAWYSKADPASLPAVKMTPRNGLGVHDLVGLVWEWTLDYNSFMLNPELRDSGSKDKALFCGAGGLGAKDATDYAAFMRYSMRASLKADYTTNNLGFRCAEEKP